MGRKFRGGAGSPSNTMWPGPTPTSIPSGILILLAVPPQQTWAKNSGGACAPLGEGELGLHLTQCRQGRGLPLCHVSSWPIQLFGHNTPTLQRDKQTDKGPVAYGEPFYKQSPKNGLPCAIGPLSVREVHILWPNGWMDQGKTRHGGRPRP